MNGRQRILVACGILTVALLVAVSFITSPTSNGGAGKLGVVATFYPVAYFASQVGGDKVQITTLIPPGDEPHTWEPKPSDIIHSDDCKVFLYNGAGIEPWVDSKILPSINTNGKVIVNCTAGVQLLVSNEASGGNKYDPHTWLDPVIAKKEVGAIAQAFIRVDPTNSAYYLANTQNMNGRLNGLNSTYTRELANKTHTVVVTNHVAFSYVGKEYGFTNIGVIGIDGESEPTITQITSITDTMKDKGIYTLYIEAGYSVAYIQSIKTSLESMSGHLVTILPLYHVDSPINGMDYFQMQYENVKNLKHGLTGD